MQTEQSTRAEAGAVAETVKDETKNVAREAQQQARTALHQVQDDLRRFAGVGKGRFAGVGKGGNAGEAGPSGISWHNYILGRRRILAVLSGQTPDRDDAPVFGCSLGVTQPDAAPEGGVS